MTLLASVTAFLWVFPVGQIWLAAGFAIYALVLLKYPRAWLIVVPVAMPSFDLAFFSGWFFFDEFDALVLVTAAILYWRQPLRRQDFRLSWPLWVAVILLCASYGASTAVQLYPWPPIDGNSFASYYSPFNALRVAKGFLWPVLLLPHLNHAVRESPETGKLLAAGLVAGLSGMALIALYEHWLFVGLFNFGHEYRITGPFSSMHTGSGHIDLWLATTIPLIAAIFVDKWPLLIRLAALGVGCLSIYILLATASRGSFLATACVLFVLVCAFVLIWTRRGSIARAVVLTPTLFILGLLVVVPFALPTELGARFQQAARDTQIRISHFREALNMRDPNIATQLIGMGLGTFPRIHEERRTGVPKMARFRFDDRSGGRYLTLQSGTHIYFGQKIDAKPHTSNLFSLIYRTEDKQAKLHILICEKWLLHSQRCSGNSFHLKPTGGRWTPFSAIVKTKDVGMPGGKIGELSRRPIEMAIYTSRAIQGISIDNVALVTSEGRDLIRNGNFSRKNDYWFWTEDYHWAWHTENMAVNVLFDQGWLGLAGVALLTLLAVGALIRKIWTGRSNAVPWLGAMVGYLVTAIVMSPFDQPRLAMLFYLICFFTILNYPRRAPANATTM